MRKKLIVFLLVAASVAPLAAAAKTTTPKTISNAVVSSTPGQAKNAIKRCAVITSKIQTKLSSFDNSKIKHLGVYADLKAQLSTTADKLAARGADVAVLRAYLVTLDEKIAKFNADYASYAAKLKDSQEYVCGKSEGEFLAKLKESRTALQWVFRDAVDIRTFVLTKIKVELNRIRQELKLAAASSTPETVTSTKATSTKPVKVKPLVPALPKLD